MNQFSNHQTQWELLKRAVKNNRVPQAIIFAGQAGLGKKAMALEFVKFLHGGEIQKQDLLLVEPQEKQIQIGQIRDLQRALSFKPQFAAFKSVIIDDAHTLNTLAQNCFLKTLEEPPGKVLFILVTAFPEMLLETVRSRCTLLKFYPTGPPKAGGAADIKALLKKDLAGKFAFTEEFTKKSLAELQSFLVDLTVYLRSLLLQDLTQGRELKQKIELVEDLRFLLSTTNINQRLALENLMLNL